MGGLETLGDRCSSLAPPEFSTIALAEPDLIDLLRPKNWIRLAAVGGKNCSYAGERTVVDDQCEI